MRKSLHQEEGRYHIPDTNAIFFIFGKNTVKMS
jgi:hypothetical protein